MKNRAIYLDRDGVLTQPLIKKGQAFSAREVDELKFIDDALQVLPRFIKAGYVLVVLTNQPDIARKDMEENVLRTMHEKLEAWAGGKDVIKKIYYCPHDDCDECECRKPKPGMIFQAAMEWNIDIPSSFLIGDRGRDIGAGVSAGCQTVLIDMPYNQDIHADFRAKNIVDACDWVLSQI